MSSRKSKLRKIIHKANRRADRQKTLVEKNRLPGETNEQMQARLTRDLSGFLDMMSEREIEEGLLAKAEELKQIEDMQSTTTEEK